MSCGCERLCRSGRIIALIERSRWSRRWPPSVVDRKRSALRACGRLKVSGNAVLRRHRSGLQSRLRGVHRALLSVLFFSWYEPTQADAALDFGIGPLASLQDVHGASTPHPDADLCKIQAISTRQRAIQHHILEMADMADPDLPLILLSPAEHMRNSRALPLRK